MNNKKMIREYRLKQQRLRLLRGEMIVPWRNARIVRMVDYKRRKARQAIWETNSK